MDTEKVKKQFNDEVGKVDLVSLEAIRVKYLGKKSEIVLALRSLGKLDPNSRKTEGAKLNSLRNEIEENLRVKKLELASGKNHEEYDLTIPGKKYNIGHIHPVTQIYNELFEIAGSMGFAIVEGPEIESDWYNFEALNFPPDHPARDTQDSLYFDENLLLRTHTSNVQIRYMENHKPPIRIVAYGRTYRRDSDMTHTPMFHQLEGLLVDDRVTFADLKGVLTALIQQMFGKDRKVRFRPHHFPFTEPSVEMDVSCGLCGGKGCRSCKHSGWLEVLGAGSVHPNVLKNSGIDPKKYQGFAFGMGVERIAMLKYGIDDMRLFYDNDLRFLEQF